MKIWGLNYNYAPLIPYVHVLYEKFVNNPEAFFRGTLLHVCFRDVFTGEPKMDVDQESSLSIYRRIEPLRMRFEKYLEINILNNYKTFDRHTFKALSLVLELDEDTLLSFIGAYIASYLFERELRFAYVRLLADGKLNDIAEELPNEYSCISKTSLNYYNRLREFSGHPNFYQTYIDYPPKIEIRIREELKRNPYFGMNRKENHIHVRFNHGTLF